MATGRKTALLRCSLSQVKRSVESECSSALPFYSRCAFFDEPLQLRLPSFAYLGRCLERKWGSWPQFWDPMGMRGLLLCGANTVRYIYLHRHHHYWPFYMWRLELIMLIKTPATSLWRGCYITRNGVPLGCEAQTLAGRHHLRTKTKASTTLSRMLFASV